LFLGKNKKKAIMIKDAFHRRLTYIEHKEYKKVKNQGSWENKALLYPDF
jgi:hypothetical protein